MGNWRTVTIIGTCDAGDVPALRKALDPGRDHENFHCLVCGGIAGLPNWAGTDIVVTGNLAERNYDVGDVVQQLQELVAIAPSLALKVHCGGDYEDRTCIATITVAGGQVVEGRAEVETIEEISQAQMERNVLAQIRRF